MLRITSLQMKNFGPYKGVQAIEFPTEPGVVIVYGQNMRGKTVLLNAIRYALFGTVIGRGSREIGVHRIGNWESAAQGEYGFSVVLCFTQDDHEYELTRLCQPRNSESPPNADSDYAQEVMLTRDGEALGPEQCELEIARAMPEQVSRFFLFDGELLKEYEELLRDDSQMGTLIKRAIERILGLPVLTNALIHMRGLHSDAQRQEGAAAQKDQKTKELGQHHSMKIEQKEQHEKAIAGLEGDRAKLQQQADLSEQAMRENQQLRSLLEKKDEKRKLISSLEESLDKQLDSLRRSMGDAWRAVTARRLTAMQKELSGRILKCQEHETRVLVIKEQGERFQRALKEDACPTCERKLDATSRERIEQKRDQMGRAAPTSTPEGEALSVLAAKFATVNEVLGSVTVEELALLHDDVEQSRVRLADEKFKLTDLEQQMLNYDESEIRKQTAEHHRVIKELSLVEKGIEDEKTALEKTKLDIAQIEKALDSHSGSDMKRERTRRDLCARLESLFGRAVDEYCDRLSRRIESDASRLFLDLTTEPEYAGLLMSGGYGLTIRHQDGSEIPVRSAGAEHIVALSLMGALQRNAPLQGPIVMDSPFGRLDQEHTSKVVQALPGMAEQVVLLVYESELHSKDARNLLAGKLKGEYRIERRSARHSQLVKSKEE